MRQSTASATQISRKLSMKILVVDDDRLIRSILSAVVEDLGHDVILASNADEALKALSSQYVDLMLTDVEMPHTNGFELTRTIRQRHADNWFPIIFLSGQTNEAHLTKGIAAGGDDYLTKPVSPVVVSAKIHAMERIAQMKRELDKANLELKRLTRVDRLTQVTNRHGLEEAMSVAWRLHLRSSKELSLMMLDIDHFKLFNDNYGHHKGDECLKSVAQTLNECVKRPLDTFARFGGEEFAVLLPETPLSGAKALAEKMLNNLKEADLRHEFSSTGPRVSVSIGISSTRFTPLNIKELLVQADGALYNAKTNGRACVACYAPEAESSHSVS